MPPTGTGECPILFVAEAPGEREDIKGVQLIGKAGQFLRERLLDVGVDLDTCRKTNAVVCRPPNNRTPTGVEIDCCRRFLKDEIRTSKPKIIVPMGNVAIQSVIGDRWKGGLGGVSKWHGWAIPDQDLGCWVCPTFHPSYVMRETTPPSADVIFKKELARIVGQVKCPFPTYPQPFIHSTTISSTVISWIEEWMDRTDPMCFDYETTGLKPHKDGHKIVSCAVSWDGVSAYAFTMDDPEVQQMFALLLQQPQIPKVAANAKFEEMWSQWYLGTPVANWRFDTMLATHVLDNREGICSVKFQAYVQLGIADYASKIKPYLEAPKEEGANGFNRILEIPTPELLHYNGMDAVVEWGLWNRFNRALNEMGIKK